MNQKILLEFENILDKEAKRIVSEINKIYDAGKKVNKHFGELVEEFINPNYKYYKTDIYLRCYRFIPDGLEEDIKGEYALITKEQSLKNHFKSYTKFCSNLGEHKDHKKSAKKLFKLIINLCKENPNSEIGLPQLIADNMDAMFPEHNDSVDARTVVMFLEEEFVRNKYEITSFIPLRIKKTNEAE